MKFSIKDFFSKCDQMRGFLCSVALDYHVGQNTYKMLQNLFKVSNKQN